MKVEKIRVLHYGLSSNNGGVEASILRTAQHIDTSRFELHFIITKDRRVCFQDELKGLGGVFHEITARRKSFLANRRDLDRLFKNHRFDLLHMHLNTLSYTAPAHYAQKHGAGILLHSRSSGASSKRVRLLHYLSRALQPWRGATRVAVSDQAGRWLFGRGCSFEVLPNGVNTQKYAFGGDERSMGRRELGLRDDCLVLGHVGAFLPVKNHAFLVDIAEILAKRGMDFALILVGAGPGLEQIRALAQDRGIAQYVKFLGARNDLKRIYSIMDLMVFPSKFEGFPNVILEAQASGLPCLASTAVPEELALSNSCKLIELEQGASVWATALQSMKPLSPNVREAAAEVVESSRFSVKNEVDRLERLYAQIARRG